MGVVIRRASEGNRGKTGMGAVLEERNGSHEAWGHFRRGKNRAAGRLLRGPEGDNQGVEDRVEQERREAILLDRATEHGVYSASH